jgi:hypothetical protein
MKKYFILFSLFVLIVSCRKDFLKEDPKGSLTSETFYKTSNDLEMASTALLHTFNGAFNQMAGFATCYGGDDVTVARAGNKISFSDFDTFQPNSSNDRMTNWWNYFYANIKSCNSLINNYQKATAATEIERNVAAGQAYFLRALSYFFLTRTWGAIPLITDNTVDYGRTKAQPADLYALIVEDLKKAESMLPNRWTGARNQAGVDIPPTKGSAKSLLANVYLTMAGWPLKQTDKYPLAAAKAKEVIDNKSTWGYDLLTNFAVLWKKEGKFNKEAVFGCYFNYSTSAYVWENLNMSGPASFGPGDEGGWDDGYGEINFYQNFPAGARKDATYQQIYYSHGNQVDWTKNDRRHPYFMKYRDDNNFNPATHAMDWAGSHTVFVIRYAEVLLTYAEATAMSTAPDQSAYDAINAVRSRAGVGDLPAGLSKEAFRDAVIAERGWEFAGLEPAARWFDLLRTETVGRENTKRSVDDEPIKNIPNDQLHTFYWAPIPINEQQLNPNLR